MISSFFFSLFFTHSALAQTADELINSLQQSQKWEQANLLIDLKITNNKRKNATTKEYQLETFLRKDAGNLYSFSEFMLPQEVTGTKILAIDFMEKDDELYLFMPALGRVNKLTNKAQKRAFMGSDISLEDLDFSTYQGSATIISENETEWRLETVSDSHPSYGKWQMTISKESRLPTFISFFNKENELWKEMTLLDTDPNNHFPEKIDVIDTIQNSTTSFVIQEKPLQTDIPLSLFDTVNLVPTKQ